MQEHVKRVLSKKEEKERVGGEVLQSSGGEKKP
jgi:hypothetical protein